MPHPYDAIELATLRQRRSSKWSKYPPDVLPAFVAEMDFPVAPAITAAMQRAVDTYDYGYAPLAANIGLDVTVAEWLRETQSFPVDAQDVIIIPDVVKGLEVGVRAFAPPGSGVIVCPPVYTPFLNACNDTGRTRVDVPLVRGESGRWMLDIEGIDTALGAGARVILLCHPHNPTGTVFRADELDALIALAHRHGAHIVSDEIHGPLTYAPHTHVPVATRPGGAEVTLTLTSASKAWNLAGLKCAFAVAGTPAMRAQVEQSPRSPRSGIGVLGMFSMLAALRDGREWLADTLQYLDANRQWLVANLPDGVGCVAPDATYLAWLDCTAFELRPTAGEHFLEKARVAFNAGEAYGDGFEGWARLNFATSRPVLEQIVDRLADSLPS